MGESQHVALGRLSVRRRQANSSLWISAITRQVRLIHPTGGEFPTGTVYNGNEGYIGLTGSYILDIGIMFGPYMGTPLL